MAGIYSKGGSAGHRYAGWLETVEAKNFTFGGKVFNGSPSAIYVGSNLVWSYWLKHATWEAILAAFGQRDGMAVIKATNAYLNQLAASDRDKATALAGFINEDPMMVCSLGLEVEGVTMPIRWLVGDGASWIRTSFYPTATDIVKATIIPLDVPNSGCPYGARNKSTGNGPGSYNDFWTNRVRIDWAASLSTDVFVGSVTNRTFYHIEEKKGYFKLNGTVLYNQTVQYETLNYPLFIFANNNADVSVKACMKAEISELSCYGKCNFIPFKSATREGMVDLVNATFHPNQGTGHFTDAYTLQDGVTPWTPSTP